MALAALIVSVLALIASGVSASYVRRQTRASENLAGLARQQDRRGRAPKFVVELQRSVDDPDPAVYMLLNTGPEDLDSVRVHRPGTADSVVYNVAAAGTNFGDAAELGPLRLGEKASFTLNIGARRELPEMSVRIESRRGSDAWSTWTELENPRPPMQMF